MDLRSPLSRNVAVASAAITVASIVMAFMAAPILRFGDPVELARAGKVTGIGVGFTYAICRYWHHFDLTAATPAARRTWTIVRAAFVSVMIGFVALGVFKIRSVADLAFAASRQNDHRCAIIQHALDHPTSRTRPDAADMFQAFGCRPQALPRR